MNKNKRSVLFLCTGNSARSQMAEALLRHKTGDKFDVFSAGTQPEVVDSRAIDTLKQFEIDTHYLVSKGIDTFAGQAFDFVITLCDNANRECRDFPNANKQLSWDFPDPKTRTDYMPFVDTLNELNNRISMFLHVEGVDERTIVVPEKKEKIASKLTKNEHFISVNPIDFYKNFTDEIRLKALMLSHYHGELCVCELMEALAEDSQPKVSRNLALLRKSHIITARKHGQWVFYRINPKLPLWAKSVIAKTTENNSVMIIEPLKRLANMKNRPNKANFCK